MRILNFIILFVLVILFFPLPSLKTVESLNFNITNFNDPESEKNMAYMGDGKASNGSIDLVIVEYLFRVGRAIYTEPLHLWDSSSGVVTNFTTRFTFTIDRAKNGTYADGFVFYIAPRGYQVPLNAAGGTFGIFNMTSKAFIPHNHVLAVEFDTNNGTIDPPMKHVGIDDNSLKSVAFAKFDIDKNLGRKCNCLITYDSSNKTLSVYWSFNGTVTPRSGSASSLSYQIDLMEILPEWVDVGFSAATAEYAERNVIHSWEFSSTLNSSTFPNSNSTDNSVGKHRNGLNHFPNVESLSFNITNFNGTESASLIGFSGVSSTVNRTIVLTSLNNNEVGRAIYGLPLHLKNSSNGVVTDFSTRFSFTINVSDTNNYGDGCAFYVAPLSYQIPPGSGGGGLGLYGEGTPEIVAVEFDTFVNDFDPPVRHVGINNNSVKSLAYSRFDIENNIGNMVHVLITYNASAKVIDVRWFFAGSTSSGFMPNTSLSQWIDLGEILPEWVTVGFSGSTGLSNETVAIHSWEFTSSLDLNSMYPWVNDGDMVVKYKVQVKLVVTAVTCSVFSVVVILGVVSWLIVKKRRKEYDFDLDRAAMPRRFNYKELVSATNGFAVDRRLGEGGSGQVYKGFLSDLGCVVAVKKIFSDVEDSERVFKNEVKIISRLIHRNLVKFMGWCHEQGELLLVFEYMTNGSLDNHLFGKRRSLTWDVRYKIALHVARALHYLHEDAEQCVLHRHIKSGNVLLDTDFNTKVSDFGMAKLVDPRLRTQKTRVVGTYGYLAPEYMKEGRASKESDMYGFGVVALEIACGRRTFKDGEYDHVPLTNWVWRHYVDGTILNTADKGLNGDFDENEMTCLLTVGIWCTHPDYKKRPKAYQVISVLKQEMALPLLSL